VSALPSLPPDRRRRLIRVLGMLGSDHLGERAAAGALADRLIRESNLTWSDVIGGQDLPTYEPPPAYEPPHPDIGWRKLAAAVVASRRATTWERGFCTSILDRGVSLTDRQQITLDRIYRERVRGERRRSF
jgi:hypothetical protein